MRKWIAWIFVIGFVAAGCKSEPQKKPDKEDEQMAERDEEKDQKPDAGAEDGGITEKMADEHEGDEPTPTEAVDQEPDQPVATDQVEYAELDGEAVTGYYAEPEQFSGELPGVIVIQEWWGLNDNIRAMTRRLAGEGYRALAVDLYEGEVAEKPDQAESLMKDAMQNKGRLEDNLRQAYQYLADEIGAPRIGVVGWCFGGGWSLQTALMLPNEIDATVIYYGELVTEKPELEPLNMPVIGFFGAEDTAIPPDQVKSFEQAMKQLDKKVEVHIYEGAGHAFANPSGQRYNPEAATDAWTRTLEFFETHLQPDEAEQGPADGTDQPPENLSKDTSGDVSNDGSRGTSTDTSAETSGDTGTE